ncbi:MAG: outer membrane protein transport protein [Candidatus Omnitrophica bacterium]|nr:outer membrane protein transport protein [Candidatus Omnitrophota bacterium]
MMKLSRFVKPTLLLCVLTLPFNNSSVFAVGSGGFENPSFSASSLGQANAVVAQADEASAISYNPAGIVYLPGVQTQTSAAFISMFTKREARNGDSNWSSGTGSLVPTAYLTINPGHYLKDRVAFGVGSDSPFGLANKYDSAHSHVHYTGWKNAIKMFTVKPVMSVKLHDKLSVGAGPIYHRVFDISSTLAYPNVLLGAGLPDGQARVNLTGDGWGWHFGALAKPHEKHQFGFYFRSPVTVQTHGRVKVENAAVGGAFETKANAKFELPLNFTWAYAYKPTRKLTVEADVGFTRWAAHERLFIDTAPVNAANDAILAAIGKSSKDYSNTWSFHLGGNHKTTERLTLRAGGLFYSNAVPEENFIPAVPDSNSLAFGLGGGYKITQNFSVDLTYFTRFWLNRSIDNSISEVLGTSVDGKYFSYLQMGMVTFSYKWEPKAKELVSAA